MQGMPYLAEWKLGALVVSVAKGKSKRMGKYDSGEV